MSELVPVDPDVYDEIGADPEVAGRRLSALWRELNNPEEMIADVLD